MEKKKANNPDQSKLDKLKYPSEEDIYNQGLKEELNEEAPGKKIKPQPEDELAEDLDIPGAELDDEDENIGEEDEENNYYSLGGDRHEE